MKHSILLFISFLIWNSVASQNIETFLTETWENENWVKMDKGTNTYDQLGFIINTSQINWDNDFNKWNNSFQTVYTNNNEGSVTQKITQSWDDLIRTWDNNQRITFNYNTNKKLSSKITENFVNGYWQNLAKELNYYDSIGNLINNLQYSWNNASSSWETIRQVNYINSNSGKVIEKVTQSWENLTNTWSNIQRTTFAYNSKDKPLTQLTETWVSSNWQNLFRLTNTFDNSGFVINTIEQKWNMDSTSWNNSEQINYTINLNGTINQKTIQFWNNLNLSWQNLKRTSFTYFQSNDIFKPKYPGFIIYPNPCKDYILIKLENPEISRVSIIDLQGKSIVSLFCSENEFSINLKDLNPNIYVLRIEQGEKIMIRKIFKN